jgi:hypothetical protein
MRCTKLYKFIIAALVIINVGILTFFLTRKPPHGPPVPGQFVNKLELEGDKRELVIKLEKAHHKEKRELMNKDRALHEILFSKIGTNEDVSNIQEEIEENHAEMEKMTYDFFNEVSTYCSTGQKEQLKKMIHHAFRQMKGPKRR